MKEARTWQLTLLCTLASLGMSACGIGAEPGSRALTETAPVPSPSESAPHDPSATKPALPPYEQRADYRMAETLNQLYGSIPKKFRLSCQGKNCIGAVVSLTFFETRNSATFFETINSAGNCTGFLVGADLIATNTHCVRRLLPEKVSFPVDCVGKIQVIIPDLKDQPGGSHSCLNIETAISEQGEDITLLRLARPVLREPLEFADPEEPRATEASYLGLEWQEGKPRVVTHDCRILDTAHTPFKFLELTWNNHFIDCRNSKGRFTYGGGHSGGPLLDPQGKVIGIFSGFFDQNRMSPERRAPSLPEWVGRAGNLIQMPSAVKTILERKQESRD